MVFIIESKNEDFVRERAKKLTEEFFRTQFYKEDAPLSFLYIEATTDEEKEFLETLGEEVENLFKKKGRRWKNEIQN